MFTLPEDWHNWMPTAHHTSPAVMEYVNKFVNLKVSDFYRANRSVRVFFLWGHSTEFVRDQNWDLIEEICKKLANREDTWYATNMQIYEYTKAFDALVYSADNSLVYNPTLQTVWFDIDETLYKIQPGETLHV